MKSRGAIVLISTRMRRGCFGLAALALSGSGASMAAAQGTLNLTEQDNGGQISARAGEEVILRLPENVTTGFRWAVEDANPKLELASATHESSRSAALGASGQALFRFRVIGTGSEKLSLKYWRQWEGDASIVKRFVVTVQARE